MKFFYGYKTKIKEFSIPLIFKRVIIAGWLLSIIFAAFNHNLLRMVFDINPFSLNVPHLKHGYVMFNHISKTVITIYLRKNGQIIPVQKLLPTPSVGYSQSRVMINIFFHPLYLNYILKKENLQPPCFIIFEKYMLPSKNKSEEKFACGDFENIQKQLELWKK